MHLSVLYRGPLSSCNYDCGYCPFAKTYDTAEDLQADAAALQRFVDWAASWPQALSVLFTPWGEALVRRHYRDAMVRLSHLPQLRRVAVQTNLCIGLDWLEQADLGKLALWGTYHPGQVRREDFVRRCHELGRLGVRYSVGMVAMREHLAEIQMLRQELPIATSLWINAYDGRDADYYSAEDIAVLTAIDPAFIYNLNPVPSAGAPCGAGETVISVNGDGDVRRCHFVSEPMGNLYDGSFAARLGVRACPNPVCDCFIGYVHRKDLPLAEMYANGALERVPARWQLPR